MNHFLLTTPGTRIGDVAARYDGELQYVVDWGGHEVSPPVSVSPSGTLTLTALLDHEETQRLSLIVTAVPIAEPELAASTTVEIEVSFCVVGTVGSEFQCWCR